MFTEAVPGVLARARVTPRAKAEMATEVLDEDRSVAAVASDYRCGWHTVHDHVITVADAVLEAEPAPVAVLGIDETRRGKAKWDTDPDTGKRIWVDRWDAGLVDITGDQGLLAQVNGRDSATVIDWLNERDADWRAAITHVAIDLSMVYARAARVGLADEQDVGGGLEVAAAAQVVDQGSVDAHGGVDIKVSEGGRRGQAGEAQPAGQPPGGGGVNLDGQQSGLPQEQVTQLVTRPDRPVWS